MTSPISEPPKTLRPWQAKSYAVRVWVIDHAPIPLLTHSHEVGISVALGIVALPLLGGRPGPESVHAQTPETLAITWAWVLLLSSVLTIWGLFANRPRVEWAGQLFQGYGLTFYAMALLAFAGWPVALASTIFGVLGLVSWWRSFKITNQPLVQARLTKAARYAHEQFHAHRTTNGGKS